MTTKTFAELGVDPALCEALAARGITHTFPIQEMTLPLALEGADIIGQARTGSGKTLGFGLPMLQRIDVDDKRVQALIVVPTRELCIQVAEELEAVGRGRGVEVLTVYGGVPIDPQIDTLAKGVHVVVGTPGRLLDLKTRRNLDLSNVRALILDEADEMLDMGFLPDVERLIDGCADDRQSLLFSATMPSAVISLARRYMHKPTFMRAEVEEHTVPDNLAQHFFLVHKMDKPRVLARILQDPTRGRVYVFCRTKYMCDRLVENLGDMDVEAIAIHGDLKQVMREKNLDKFRAGKVDVLVATEVAARGIDVDGVTHVINYDCPDDEKMYLHRIGRTARAGASGASVTFATANEVDRLNVIRKRVDMADEPLAEAFSTSPLLTEAFNLPEETPWGHLGTLKDRTANSKVTLFTGDTPPPPRPDAEARKAKKAEQSSRPAKSTKTGTDAKKADAPAKADKPDRKPRKAPAAKVAASAETDAPVETPKSTFKAATGDAPPPRPKRTSKSDSENQAPAASSDETVTKDTSTDEAPPRRRRARPAEVAAVQAESEQSESADSTTPSTPNEDGSRTRTRTRTRSTEGGSSTESRERAPRQPREPREPRDNAGRSETREREPGRDSNRNKQSAGRDSNRSRGGRNRNGSGNSSNGGSNNRNRGGNSNSGGTRAAGKGNSIQGTDVAPTLRGDEARGEGKPRFEREVVIDHLP